VLTVAWTLVWELIFYVVFAVILQFPRKFVYAALGGWLVAEFVMHATLAGSSNFYLQFASAPLPLEFIGGTAIGLLYVHRKMPAAVLVSGLAIVLAALFWSSVASAHLELQPEQMLRVVAFGIPAMLLVYAAVALEGRGLLVAPHWLAAIGDGSYAIYLWHLSVLVVLRQVILRLPAGGPLLHAAVIILTLAIIITVGMAVYRFFERPVTTYLNGLLAMQLPARKPVAPLRPRTVSGGGGE
jgi:peptidoglycan/LPS O-acetylase OafA/YrhL